MNENNVDSYTSIFTRRKIDVNELKKILKSGANHGVCGGYNLGNTCFMNSSIACLSNCTELTTYFLTEEFQKDINKKNKEGTGGKLAKAWYSLLKEYWNSSSRTGSPGDVKSAVAKKVPKFSGFNQQDSNEFMTEFLSILGEDLNKSTEKKKYEELEEKKDNESDLDCAKRFWELHILRNDSIVTDLFSGLFKSTVTCPKCQWKSITFEPFNTLILSIPRKKNLTENVSLFFIPKYSIRKSIKLNLIVPRNSKLDDLTKEMQKIPDFKYKFNKLIYISVSDKLLKNILDGNTVKNRTEYVFGFELENEKSEILPLYIKKNEDLSSFPRLVFADKNMTFLDFKKKIYYYVRQYITNPLKTQEKETDSEVDKELDNYINAEEPYCEDKLISLIDKEFDRIFSNQKENEEFLNDLPFNITLTKEPDSDKEEYCLLNGENNFTEKNKELKLNSDNDSIEEIINKIKKENYNLVVSIKTQSNYSKKKINLNSCLTVSSPEEEEKGINLEDCIEYLRSEECLEKGNEWLCKQCKTKVSASKKLDLFYLPRILSICFKRFAERGGYYNKNDTFINYPIKNLDMGKYLCGPDKEHSKYDLYAISQHYGGTGGGHYTAACKNFDGNWYDYNDSSCSRTSESSAVSSAAYVIFYRRQSW